MRKNEALRPLTPTKRFLSANIERCAKKVLLVQFQQCVSLPSKRTRIYALSGRNLTLLSLGITTTASGRRVINLLWFFARTRFAFSRAWLLLLAAPFARTIARMPSVREFFHPTRLLSYPSGNPEASPDEYWLLKRTLYGLRRSPRHWYDQINAILRSIGLTPSLEDPCLHTGYICDPANPSASILSAPLSIGLYVDDFVYFSEDPAVEALFCRLLSERCKVDFMGIVEWFLGVHFSWCVTSSSVLVHMNQSGFATNLVESFSLQSRNETPTATPYRSGVPIDSIAPSTDADDSLAQIRRKEAFQSLVGSIGWLSSTTRPDLTAAHSFLSSYTNKPASGHMKAGLYVLHYIHSMHDYGISFTSDDTAPMHSYVHYPPSSDTEAYEDAIPPKLGSSNQLSAYSDACWIRCQQNSRTIPTAGILRGGSFSWDVGQNVVTWRIGL